ncbi:MAG: aminotransferase class I/II-fold pyridoxal phosphate-dependent enzyme [Hamadaea sp.]|nr:aminotransferase class I/II-fold pyridoxal phosphate-dependent enzyme [Hamadaea sp.]NUR50078.1 aminotransferase class I/II-fold pyridoxal phosphate-dependent enzyme [Hamadaea sp.]NUT04129.1 aminotransferase class I/II-fold pyridoxal phosphate-dependent enzyme [Hamadaea sp.]
MADPFSAVTPAMLRRRTSVKWRTYPEDVLPAFVAEMDVDLAEPVRAALEEALRLSDTGYPAGDGYAEALSAFAGRRWGWAFETAQTSPVADVMTGVVEALRLVTGRGDAVVVNPPVYFPFFGFVEHAGRRIVEAPLGPDGRIDFAVLEAAFRHAASAGSRAAYLLCNPHNPTGAVHTRAELERIAQLAHGYGVRVVADEIHAPLVPAGASFVPYLSVDDRGISLMSASKAWNLAGLKAALMIGGVQAVDDVRRLPEHVAHGTSHFGTIAHTAALRHGEAWLDDLLVALDHNRRLLGELLSQQLPEVGYRAPEGTYLTWLDCRALAIEGEAADFFLERGRIAFAPGRKFGTGGAGHVRGTIAASTESIADGVARMVAALTA